jgi:hypothetical protein
MTLRDPIFTSLIQSIRAMTLIEHLLQLLLRVHLIGLHQLRVTVGLCEQERLLDQWLMSAAALQSCQVARWLLVEEKTWHIFLQRMLTFVLCTRGKQQVGVRTGQVVRGKLGLANQARVLRGPTHCWLVVALCIIAIATPPILSSALYITNWLVVMILGRIWMFSCLRVIARAGYWLRWLIVVKVSLYGASRCGMLGSLACSLLLTRTFRASSILKELLVWIVLVSSLRPYSQLLSGITLFIGGTLSVLDHHVILLQEGVHPGSWWVFRASLLLLVCVFALRGTAKAWLMWSC